MISQTAINNSPINVLQYLIVHFIYCSIFRVLAHSFTAQRIIQKEMKETAWVACLFRSQKYAIKLVW